MELRGDQIIGSRFSREGTDEFHAVNPVNGKTLAPPFCEATDGEVDRALRSAQGAFREYRKKSPQARAAFLERIGEEIMASGDDLIRRCTEETALAEARLKAERTRTVNQLKLFADVLLEGSWVEARIDTAIPDRQPVPKPDIRQMLIPLGPVGVFGASNFPLAFSVAGGDTASALAAGCPVVVKAHPAHPGTSEIVGRAIRKAAEATSMPEGVFSLLHGLSVEPGMAIVRHPLTRAVAFTGSFSGGRALYDAAASRLEPIPVYAEMGSTNPVILLPGALKERGDAIANGLAASVTLGAGQFCTNPGLVFVIQSEEAVRFIDRLAAELAAVPSAAMLSKNIKSAYDEGIKTLKKKQGVQLKYKGKPGKGKCRGVPHLLQTSLEPFLKHPRIAKEIFGPSTVVVTVKDGDQLLEAVSSLNGHLTASIHCSGDEIEAYPGLVSMLENRVGRLIVNGFPTGVEVCPAMHHGGPFPATTDLRTTSVGTAAIKRFVRPVCYQNFPSSLLPDALKDENPLNILRLVNGRWERAK
jgi:NADP-dependent aldehyde dehydrogenase